MIIYEVGTTDFSKNGLGYLPNVLNASVIDEINGEYSLTFDYPVEDAMAKEITEERIIKCQVADGTKQCFIIKTIQKNFDTINVYCTHLFYLLYDNFVDDTYPQNLSPKPFLDWILQRANYQLPFTTTSDITISKSARYVRKNIVETIIGDIDNSMYKLFGMELKRDNWNIGLNARIGSDKGEKLIFGKNITGVDINVDTTGLYTRIMPIGFDGLLLPELYVDAPNINAYPYPRICLYNFDDVVYDPDDPNAYHNIQDAYQALRDGVNKLYAAGMNEPLISIKVNWLELSRTEEYKQYSALERVDLGDTLTCNLFGMDYTTRVIKTKYNPLTDMVEQFEIGTLQPSITKTMNELSYDVINLPTSILDEAQTKATQLITQAMGGYVYKTQSELYIMDNPDPAQAVKVWRWNINGLGYSSTGINGTYGIAMTMNGAIVADFITTGQLSANVINASTIIGVINGNTSQLKIDADQLDISATDVLNILAGNSLNLTSNNITINSTNFSVDSGGNMSCSNATITGGDINLVDDGLNETISKIEISGRDNVTTNKMFSHGIEINSTYGKKIEMGTSTTEHFNAQKIIGGNAKEVFKISEDGAIISQYYDNNNNLTRWATLFPGTNNDSAFTLGTGSSTNFEIHNEQNSTYAKIKGALVATDSNGNETFSVNGSNGNITTAGKIIIPQNSVFGIRNSSDIPILRDWNGAVTLDGGGGDLYVGHQYTQNINFLDGKMYLMANGLLSLTSGEFISNGNIKFKPYYTQSLDLNDIGTSSNPYSQEIAIHNQGNISNAPTNDEVGILKCYSWGGNLDWCVQEYFSLNSHHKYIRFHKSDGWTNWRQIV